MEVKVIRERCVGQGMCVLYAERAFVLSDEDGCSETRFLTVPRELEDSVRQAAQACPEQAIRITE